MILTFQTGRVSTRSYARLTAFSTEPIAPLAAQVAPARPITKASTDVPVDVSCCSVSTVSSTSPGAIGARNSFSVG